MPFVDAVNGLQCCKPGLQRRSQTLFNGDRSNAARGRRYGGEDLPRREVRCRVWRAGLT